MNVHDFAWFACGISLGAMLMFIAAFFDQKRERKKSYDEGYKQAVKDLPKYCERVN